MLVAMLAAQSGAGSTCPEKEEPLVVSPWPFPDENPFSAGSHQPTPDGADARLGAEVAQVLSVHPTTRGQGITVEVQNRVVILAGVVTDPAARQVAGALAWETEDVFDVCNILRLVGDRRPPR